MVLGLWNRWMLRSRDVVLQSESTECGLACLAMIAARYDRRVTLRWLRRRYPVSLRGTTVARLSEIARDLGLQHRVFAGTGSALRKLDATCVILVDDCHFVVVERCGSEQFLVLDPAVGELVLSCAELEKRFSGALLRFTGGSRQCEDMPVEPSPWSALTSQMRPRRLRYLPILFLALVAELLTVAAPLYIQSAVDGRGGAGVFNAEGLLLIFAFIAIARVWAASVRSLLIADLGASIVGGLSNSVFGRVLELPPSYFLRRHPADVISRLGSVHEVQELASSRIVECAVDALALFILLAACCTYSLPLAVMAASGAALCMAVRVSMSGRVGVACNVLANRLASQDREVIETLRAAQTVKLNGMERLRGDRFRRGNASLIRASISLQRMAIFSQSGSDVILGLLRVLVVYAGVLAVDSGALSVGALVAVTIYVEMICQRASALVPKVMDVKMARAHLQRISEVLSEPAEECADWAGAGDRCLAPSVVCRGIHFRYSIDDPWVLKDVSLTIRPGEMVAIVGPSGVGKSTLLSILAGLVAPTDGVLEVDGCDVKACHLPLLRRQIGTVLQQDTLLSGTVLENITLGEVADIPRVWQCLAAAGLDNFASSQPMALSTQVGDEGRLLSGGQQKRLLLARALYRAPRVLVLDETLSQLDYEAEQQIMSVLLGLQMTRIIVTHRVSTLPEGVRVIRVG